MHAFKRDDCGGRGRSIWAFLNVLSHNAPKRSHHIQPWKRCSLPRKSVASSREMHNGDGFDIRYDQTEAGEFKGECLYRGSMHMVFCREQYSRGVCIHGTVPYGMVTAVMSTKRKGSSRLNGDDLSQDCLGVLTPGDDGAYQAPAGYSFTNFIISQERLERAVRALFQLPLLEILKHTATLHLSGAAISLLRESTAEIFTPSSPEAISGRKFGTGSARAACYRPCV